MSEVRLSAGGGRFSLSVRGHAPDAARCAAVSALVYTLCGWLRNAAGVELEAARLAPGDALLVWRGGEAAREFALVGFLQLEKTGACRVTVNSEQ